MAGYHIYGKREYYSNIKGRHSYFQMRVSETPIGALVEGLDHLVTFDDETVVTHLGEVKKAGYLFYNPDVVGTKIEQIPTLERRFREELLRYCKDERIGNTVADLIKDAEGRGVKTLPVPYQAIIKAVADKIGREKLGILQRTVNTIAVAASLATLDFDPESLAKSIAATFSRKESVIKMNNLVAETTYDHVKQTFPFYTIKLPALKIDEKRILVQGTMAVAMGKVVAGCRFQTYYPITPASDESEYLEAHEHLDMGPETKDTGILVVQTEDEIAAINYASGAALAGARAATATSGPGFSLMVEGLGWAGMNEVPLVVTLYQRGSPSTGLPTRHEQGDLKFAINAGHGDFARIVLASGDTAECFYDAITAFNLAEKYQMPVIHLIDKSLANSTQTIKAFDLSKVRIDRGLLLTEADLARSSANSAYRRFRLSNNGVSPRALLGTKGGVFWNTGDEHDELGHITEDPVERVSMMEKRLRKLDLIEKKLPQRDRWHFFGKGKSDATIVSWGSTKGVILEAMKILEKQGMSLDFLQLRLLNPLPVRDVQRILGKASMIVDVETNFYGQLADLIQQKTCIPIKKRILKYNGRPITTLELKNALRKMVTGKKLVREVLRYGA